MGTSKKAESTEKVVLYTDGSCAPTNPGPGGWAYLPVVNGEPDELVQGSEARSTNNRMELTAALEALKSREIGETVQLFTDSEYLRLGITQWMDAWIRNGWTRSKGQPVLNQDLWTELHAQNNRIQVQWHWVKAHAGHVFNELVDRAARDAAISAAGLVDVSSKTGDGRTKIVPEVPPSAAYAITAVNAGDRRSSWAFVCESEGREVSASEVEEGSSVNRALLVGTVALMRSLKSSVTVRVTTDSEYLFNGVTRWLHAWRRRGWRKSDSKPVANQDLWIEIDSLLSQVDIEWHLERRSKNQSSYSLIQVAARVARDTLALSRE